MPSVAVRTITLFVAAALAAALIADDKPARRGEKDTSEAAKRIERLKKLAGAWQGVEGEEGEPGGNVFYRVISGGSAVAEFLLPGTEHEMVSMYHRDGDALLMTHYCAVGNQPRLKARPGGPENEITFEFMDGTNIKSPDDLHIDGLKIQFISDDEIVASWSARAEGKHQGGPSFRLKRVKDKDEAARIAALVGSLPADKADRKP